jgi:hypothetical protein
MRTAQQDYAYTHPLVRASEGLNIRNFVWHGNGRISVALTLNK